MRNLALLVALLIGAGAGCGKQPPVAAPPTVVSNGPSQAQPKLPTIKLFIGTNELETELATTPLQMATGMMFRQSMAETEGMIFVFPAPQRASFYMRNTTVPLSCAYIDNAGIIREIYDMKPLDETPIAAQSDQIRFCLEVPQGWFQRHHVVAGMAVGTQRGTLMQTFFGTR
jgi:uncharacterized membrane protein (UPF0127 family)